GRDGADLVVGVHDAHQRGGAVEGLADRLGIDQAVAVNRQDGDPAAEPLEEVTRLKRGGMLDGAGDDVGAPGPAAEDAVQLGEDGPLESVVAGLAAAAGANDLFP